MSTKTTEVLKQLEAGIKSLFDSDRYREYLRFLARFQHTYSLANTVMIFNQMPTASLCAGMTTWNKAGFFVKRGQRGLRIIAPSFRKETDENGDERILISYHPATCYDISQVAGQAGKTVPVLSRPVLASVAGYSDLFAVLRDISPVPISFETIPGDTCNGYFHPSEHRIAIKEGLSEAMNIRVAIHEIAHALLHSAGAEEENAGRRIKETEAESVAFVVSEYLGLDTSDYSVGYLASYASEQSLPEFRASLEIIKKTADSIIGMLEERGYSHEPKLCPVSP